MQVRNALYMTIKSRFYLDFTNVPTYEYVYVYYTADTINSKKNTSLTAITRNN